MAVIDTTSDTVIQNIPVGPTVFDLTTVTQAAITPDSKHAYVTSQAGNSVSVIDTASNAIVQTIEPGTSPSGVAVTPDGAHVYVSNRDSNNVSVIDTAGNTGQSGNRKASDFSVSFRLRTCPRTSGETAPTLWPGSPWIFALPGRNHDCATVQPAAANRQDISVKD